MLEIYWVKLLLLLFAYKFILPFRQTIELFGACRQANNLVCILVVRKGMTRTFFCHPVYGAARIKESLKNLVLGNSACVEIGNVIVFPNSVRFLCIREAAAGWLAGRLRQTLSGRHEKCENFRQSRLRHYYGNSAPLCLENVCDFLGMKFAAEKYLPSYTSIHAKTDILCEPPPQPRS